MAPFINKETEPILMYDPLPPLDSINIYQRPVLTNNATRLLPDASPLSMFFRTLLPNFNVQDGRFVAPEALAEARNNQNQGAGAAGAWQDDGADDQALMDEIRLLDEIDNGECWKLKICYEQKLNDFCSFFFFQFKKAVATNDLNQPLTELRNSLTSVVDAMRDFLTNIRVPELPNDADVDENDASSDDGANDNYLT